MATRRGYTLFELMLVMSLILAAAALTVPLVDSLLLPNRVQSAADLVKGKWVEVRGRAMVEGRPYRFLVKENTGAFRIEPEDEAAFLDEGTPLVQQGELPENVLFVRDPGTLQAEVLPDPGTDWQSVVVFLPDGTASEDVALAVGTKGVRGTLLRIRAVTATISQVDPGTEVLP